MVQPARYLVGGVSKFKWACEQAEAIKDAVRAYGQRKTYTVLVERDVAGSLYVLRFKVLEEMPHLKWGLQLADCMHNYRASLDLALYGLVLSHIRPNRPPKPGDIQFPIVDDPDPEKFPAWRLGPLKPDATVLTAIQRLQPYSRPSPPHRPALALLRDFDNTSKHRIISPTRAWMRELHIPIDTPPGHRLRTVRKLTVDLQDGAEIMAFTVEPPHPNVEMDEPILTFYPAIGLRATLEAHAGGYLNRVELPWLLDYVRDEVAFCLREMNGLFAY